MAQISNMTMSAVQLSEAGEASGINNTLRQVGSTFGSAIIGSILLTYTSAHITSGVEASALIPPQAQAAVIQTLSSENSLEAPKNLQGVPVEVQREMGSIVHEAMTGASKASLLWAVLFVFLGFLASFRLPNTRNLERQADQPKAAH